MLTATLLTKRYFRSQSIDAVQGVNLEIDSGQFVAIVGRSGSGKSTLLSMLGGLCSPTSGTVVIDAVDQWKLPPHPHADFRNREIGFVFQFASLLPSLSALDNVALPALVAGALNERAAYARARRLLEDVGLGKRYDFYPSELSGGEQRRVAIARALINSPKLLLADEPTADLDETTEEEILNLLIDLRAVYGLTLVVVTHNPSIAAHADRIITMKDGHIVEDAKQTPQLGGGQVVPKMLASTSNPEERVTLGEGIERFIGQLVLLTVPIIALLWCLNFAIREFQAHLIEEQRAARLVLEETAMNGLRADIKDVTFGPDGTYNVKIYLRNTLGDKPIYILAPTVRAFIQVDSTWEELPLKAARTSGQVITVAGEQVYSYKMKADVARFTQLLPYYMHIRFSNEMLVSLSSQPKNDLVARSDNYYVYLKPQTARDELILQRMRFPGKPPVWIPMPPH